MLAAMLAALPAASTGAQGEGALRDRIGSAKARERTLAGAAARLGRLEAQTARQVTILESRVSAAQADLTAAENRLAATQRRLEAARKRVVRLRKRLAEVRRTLASLLRARYMGDRPDFVTVVLHSDGFPQLLETLSFIRRVERADTRILDLVRSARADAGREQRTLTILTARQVREATAVRTRRDALAGIAAGLRARRDAPAPAPAARPGPPGRDALAGIAAGLRARRAALARARAARLAALSRPRSRRGHAEGELSRLLAARARAAMATGPGGPWAIPWPVVQCESGGQNLPPNSAGASGYYQVLDTTWAGLGGSTPHAYQAGKGEQDRLAARLWAGGAGASNWVCAVLLDVA